MKIIGEKEAEDFLEKEGFKIVPNSVVKDKEAFSKLSVKFPWAIKIISKKIVHKAKSGGVILNVRRIKEAENAFDRLKKLPGFEGVLVQEMMEGKGDLIILGLKETPEFGIVIMVGAGGSRVEELKDVSFRVTPITKKDAEEMIKEIETEIKNKAELEKNILKLNELAVRYPEINELDINPIIITEKEGVVIDARMVLK